MDDAILGLAEISLCQFSSTDKCLLYRKKIEVYIITSTRVIQS